MKSETSMVNSRICVVRSVSQPPLLGFDLPIARFTQSFTSLIIII